MWCSLIDLVLFWLIWKKKDIFVIIGNGIMYEMLRFIVIFFKLILELNEFVIKNLGL